MVELVTIDGVHQIKAGDVVVPMAKVLLACSDGAFDECRQFYKVVRLYLDYGDVKDQGLMPLFRQSVAVEAVKWAAKKYGTPCWLHNQIHMPLDVAIVRNALLHQIEGSLATIASSGDDLNDKACLFYKNMLGLGDSDGGLSSFGQEVLTDMFDSLLDEFKEHGLRLPKAH